MSELKPQFEVCEAEKTNKKVKIESHGISPWHYYLENMSWGSSGGQDDNDIMGFLNVAQGLKNGGRGLEDVLMADFLNILDFIPREFINTILKETSGGQEEKPTVSDNVEIKGNAGNYYIPYEDADKGVLLAQPDGWIADENILILLEAKGFKKSSALNKGQLAKEYLIAESIAQATGKKKFYVMLIVNRLEDIYKSYSQGDSLCRDGFDELFRANLKDLKESFGKRLSEKREWNSDLKQYISGKEVVDKNISFSEIKKHFLWITWDQINELAVKSPNTTANQIVKTISFHKNTENLKNTEPDGNWPVFSILLHDLAENKEPLYLFYNGGCGNKTLQKYEHDFLSELKEPWDHAITKRWSKWHENSLTCGDLFTELLIMEEHRRIALSLLRQVKKEINTFYKKNIANAKPCDTTRKAFSILGEVAQAVENEKTSSEKASSFEQRMQVKKIKETTDAIQH